MKKILAFIISLVFAVGILADPIKPPKGFTKKVYDASYALYATSVERGFTEPKFICTVTAIQKIQDGYLLLGAGHCTVVNPDLPDDMQFFIETDLGRSPAPVELLTAKFTEQFGVPTTTPITTAYDYALFYLKTTAKIPTIQVGNEGSLRIGSPTLNVNFSEGQAKYVSPGLVSTLVLTKGLMNGFFGVQEFASHGASGSSIVDPQTKKIVGLLIAGDDGETLPNWIEPISLVEADLNNVNILDLIAKPSIPNVPRNIQEYYLFGGTPLFAGWHGSRSGFGGHGKSSNSHSTSRPNEPNRHGDTRPERPRHEGGRSIDREVFARHFGRDHQFRPEIYFNGGFYSTYYAGFWFDFEDQWPYPVEDVFIDFDAADGLYYMCSPIHPGVRVQVWIP